MDFAKREGGEEDEIVLVQEALIEVVSAPDKEASKNPQPDYAPPW
ncbi:MAG: hypothetical protein P8X86_01155 [Desulfofustis sp.]